MLGKNESSSEYYLRVRESAQGSKTQEREKLDKILFVLSTGALVLSINFLITDNFFANPILLLIAWIFLMVSIFFHLFGFCFSENRCEKIILRLDTWKEKGFEPTSFNPETDNTKKLRKWTGRLNNLTIFTLVLGMVFLAVFVSINFYNKCMSKQNSSISPQDVQEEKANNIIIPVFTDGESIEGVEENKD